MSAPPELSGGLTIPEIGPSLGRLTDPPGTAAGALGLTLDDVRIELVSGIFELAGASRQFAAAGDREGALQSLGRAVWLKVWEQAVAAVATQITDAANTGFEAAAAESRLPARRLALLRLTPDDTQAAIARLGAGSADFIAALDALEPAATAAAAAGDRGRVAWRAWQEALGAAARRLESAWRAVETQAAAEQSRWTIEIARVRAWRRPMWPLWLVTTAVASAAVYLGLMLGGYVPVPPPLQGLADFVWAHQWI